MTEQTTGEPQAGQDCNDIVMAEIVHPGGRWLPWVVAAVLVSRFFSSILSHRSKFALRGSEWVFALLVGFCIGQVNLIAVWASLAPGNIVLRASWSLLLTMAMWYGLILGVEIAHRSPINYVSMTRSDAILLIIVLLVGVAILQIPLWIAKKVFRWRLTRRPDDTAASLQEDRQFQIQHLLVATVLVALALSPLRRMLPPGTVDSLHLDRELFVLLPAVILCNIVVVLPCIWWAFARSAARPAPSRMGGRLRRPHNCRIRISLRGAWLTCAGFWEPPLTFYLLNLSQCVAILGTLWILRAIGFRMVCNCRARRRLTRAYQCATAWNKQCRTQPFTRALLVPSSGTRQRESV